MLNEYIRSFGIAQLFDEKDVVRIDGRFFLRHDGVFLDKSVVYAGRYLGRVFNNKFVPGIDLLWMMKERTDSWVCVNKKAEWLVVCGRDVLGESIVAQGRAFGKDEKVLVLTMEKEPIGVGRILEPDFSKKTKAIKMQFDIGSLIRKNG